MNGTRPLLTALSALLFVSAPLLAQKDASAKKLPNPEVAKKLKEFSTAIKDKKFKRDSVATGIIDELLQDFEEMHPKDKESFTKSLGSVFKGRNTRRKADNPGLFRAAVFALGDMGSKDQKTAPAASKILVTAYGKKPFSKKQWMGLRENMLENVGKTKDVKQKDFLVDEATRSPHDGIKAAAGKAIRYYAELKLGERKVIFKKLLRNYAKVEDQSTKNIDPGDMAVQTAKRTLQKIADPWNTTLAALTGEEFRTAERWQRFWNKNKDKNWDKN